jgi:hypothetical protein
LRTRNWEFGISEFRLVSWFQDRQAPHPADRPDPFFGFLGLFLTTFPMGFKFRHEKKSTAGPELSLILFLPFQAQFTTHPSPEKRKPGPLNRRDWRYRIRSASNVALRPTAILALPLFLAETWSKVRTRVVYTLFGCCLFPCPSILFRREKICPSWIKENDELDDKT